MSSQTTNPRPSGSASSARLSEELRAMLQTPYEDVYQVSEDGLTYVKPASLWGVPVRRSGEGSPYWQSNWSSLDAYIAGEQGEEELKQRALSRLAVDPDDKGAKKEKKLRTDNMSKQRRIRDIFHGGHAHPNQVVAKRFLPLAGLCEQEIMYHMGCKTADLQVLANHGLLAMNPWDFYRWRVGRVLMDRQSGLLPGSKRDATRSVINGLDSERGSDPLFREAVIYSARLQGRYAAYGSKKKPSAGYKQNGKLVWPPRSPSPTKKSGNIHQKLGRLRTTLATTLPARQNPSSGAGFAERRRAEQERVRAERRARAATQSTGYVGVNAYRARQANENDSGSDTRDCGDGERPSSKF